MPRSVPARFSTILTLAAPIAEATIAAVSRLASSGPA